jgi:hypothetical protein
MGGSEATNNQRRAVSRVMLTVTGYVIVPRPNEPALIRTVGRSGRWQATRGVKLSAGTQIMTAGERRGTDPRNMSLRTPISSGAVDDASLQDEIVAEETRRPAGVLPPPRRREDGHVGLCPMHPDLAPPVERVASNGETRVTRRKVVKRPVQNASGERKMRPLACSCTRRTRILRSDNRRRRHGAAVNTTTIHSCRRVLT